MHTLEKVAGNVRVDTLDSLHAIEDQVLTCKVLELLLDAVLVPAGEYRRRRIVDSFLELVDDLLELAVSSGAVDDPNWVLFSLSNLFKSLLPQPRHSGAEKTECFPRPRRRLDQNILFVLQSYYDLSHVVLLFLVGLVGEIDLNSLDIKQFLLGCFLV